MDVTVSSIGNADSLRGEFFCKLHFLDQITKIAYAVAQGPVSVGGLSAGNAMVQMFRLIIQQ